jgi:hypothetical protein
MAFHNPKNPDDPDMAPGNAQAGIRLAMLFADKANNSPVLQANGK